jgi:copper(I)-binding protein
MRYLWKWLLAGMLLLSACGAEAEGGVEVHDAWMRPAVRGENAAVYFDLHNHSSTADELLGASSDVAEAVELHESAMEGDVMTMNMLPSLALAAGAEVTFEPGGLHIMLIRLKQDIQTDDHVELVLHFKNSGDLMITAHVVDTASTADAGQE